MARIKRVIPQEGALHVMCRGNNKQIVFNGDSDKLRYYSLMRELKDENSISIIHYCLMNNHVHLIFMLNSLCKISRFMQQLNLSYFIYYRDVYGYVGHLFQGRFKSKIIENNHYLLQCGKYVELNPVRAGLVNLPHEYRFSSYNHYAKGKPDSLLTEDPFYSEISDRPERRRKVYEEFVIDNDIIRGKFPKKGRPFKNNGDASTYFWQG